MEPKEIDRFGGGKITIIDETVNADGLRVEISRSQHTLRELAARALRTGSDLVKGGPAPAVVADERMAICKDCEYYHAESKRCTVCGCIMPLKTKVAKAECPLQEPKWKGVEPRKD